jgi:ketosteroid isomerase-like protein
MIRALPLLVAALAAAPVPAQLAEGNAEILAAAKAFDDAQLHGDRAALEALLANDFLFVRGSGRVGDRRDFIAGFTDPKSKLDPFEISDRLFVRVSTDVAIVGGEAWVRGSDGGTRFAEHFRYADTFAKRGGRWVVVYTQVTGLPSKKVLEALSPQRRLGSRERRGSPISS